MLIDLFQFLFSNDSTRLQLDLDLSLLRVFRHNLYLNIFVEVFSWLSWWNEFLLESLVRVNYIIIVGLKADALVGSLNVLF